MRKIGSIEYHNYKLIENELMELENNKKELIKLRGEIYESTPFSEIHVQSGPGNPTAAKAEKVMSSKVIFDMERRIRGIEEGVETLKLRKEKPLYQLVVLKYFEKITSDEVIANKLNLSGTGRTYWRWQKEAIEIIAAKLGWKV